MSPSTRLATDTPIATIFDFVITWTWLNTSRWSRTQLTTLMRTIES
jgi:hypothetical protein